MDELLSADELARWTAWKQAADAVWDRVVADIAAATGLSAADFAVLTRLIESGAPLRQQQLADLLGWQRSRLSRQLGRMAERGLLERLGDDTERVVRPTRKGRSVTRAARVAHARAVRAVLLRPTQSRGAATFWGVIGDLAATSRHVPAASG